MKLIITESQFNSLEGILLELSRRTAKKAAKKTIATSTNPDDVAAANQKLIDLKNTKGAPKPPLDIDSIIRKAKELLEDDIAYQQNFVNTNSKNPKAIAELKRLKDMLNLLNSNPLAYFEAELKIETEQKQKDPNTKNDSSIKQLTQVIAILKQPKKKPAQQPQPQTTSGATASTSGATSGATSGTTAGKSAEELKRDGKIALDMILNNQVLRDAFYKQPSLWNLFMAELKGEKAPGQGIIPTMEILKNFNTKKLSEEYPEFKVGQEVKFEPMVPYTINLPDGTTFKLNAGEEYTGEVNEPKYNNKYLIISNKEQGFSLTVINKIENNEYKCKLTKTITNNNGKVDKKTLEEVLINFKPSDGYTSETPEETNN